MKMVSLCLWLLVPLALSAALATWGTPHLVTSYRFLDNGDCHNPRAERVYISCNYFGWTGARVVPAIDGYCPWFRFFKDPV